MTPPLDHAALKQLFLDARTFITWQDKPVSDALLEQAWALAVMGPTGANCQPLRVRFLRSKAEKDKLAPCLMPPNVPKVMTAPVTALLAAAGDVAEACFQGGALLIALRAMGLDCGPIGFDRDAVDAAFFRDNGWRSVLLINIGHGDRDKLHPRGPRFDFHEVCAIG